MKLAAALVMVSLVGLFLAEFFLQYFGFPHSLMEKFVEFFLQLFFPFQPPVLSIKFFSRLFKVGRKRGAEFFKKIEWRCHSFSFLFGVLCQAMP